MATNYHTSTGYHSAFGVYKPKKPGLVGKQTGPIQSKGPQSFGPTPPVGGPAAGAQGPPPTSAAAMAAIANAYGSYQNTLAGLGAQEQQYGQDYGFNAAGGIDASNPNSRAALLRQSYERASLGNTNSMAARGQLYAGSTQNAQNFTTTGYNQNSDRLRRAYLALISGINLKRQQAKTNYYGATSGAAGQAADQGFGYGTIPGI